MLRDYGLTFPMRLVINTSPIQAGGDAGIAICGDKGDTPFFLRESSKTYYVEPDGERMVEDECLNGVYCGVGGPAERVCSVGDEFRRTIQSTTGCRPTLAFAREYFAKMVTDGFYPILDAGYVWTATECGYHDTCASVYADSGCPWLGNGPNGEPRDGGP
jgi:hypothetical protein